MDHHLRRRALTARLDDLSIDALLITRLLHTRYLTGFTGSNGQVLVRPDAAVFLTDGRYTEQSRREVPDLERITCLNSLREELPAYLSGVRRLGFEADEVTVGVRDRLAEALGDIELVATTDVVEALRAVKDDDERAAIRQAQAITDAAFDRILEHFAVGVSEHQISRQLETLMLDEGAEGLAFDSIVAFGENAAEPHHEPANRLLEEGDVIKLDFGARFAGYHADMTRTIAFGQPAGELSKIHDIVKESQQAGIDAVRAGVSGSAVDAVSRDVIERAGYGERFVHSLGHGVGLEIHEAPSLGRKQDDPLPAGAVVTVEPGIYIPGLGGARIEDMVEVTDDGCVVVGTSTRELIEL
ncbi:MAG: Xaa-Pro peptidase family protein [Actinomycetota bacterium]